jgi:hypothetical protein
MKQHFVPAFYLKRFTLENGLFYVYDVVSNRFKKNGKLFSPNSHFYQIDLNTLRHQGETSFFIETSFSKHDTDIGEILVKIDKGDAKQLTPHEWTYLQYFTNILYWRNPSTTPVLQKMIAEAKNLSAFGMSLRDKLTGERASDEAERRMILDHPEFIKFLRLKMPGTTYPQIFAKYQQDYATIHTFSPGLPKLVSDNPVIYLDEQNVSLHTAPVIFPLTPTKVLFRHLRPTIVIPNYIRVKIDMILAAQATNYISCTDQRYPGLLLDTYYKNYSSLQQAKQEIAELLIPAKGVS